MEKSEIINFIRENLSIKIEDNSYDDYDHNNREIRISLVLSEEEISTGYFNVSDR